MISDPTIAAPRLASVAEYLTTIRPLLHDVSAPSKLEVGLTVEYRRWRADHRGRKRSFGDTIAGLLTGRQVFEAEDGYERLTAAHQEIKSLILAEIAKISDAECMFMMRAAYAEAVHDAVARDDAATESVLGLLPSGTRRVGPDGIERRFVDRGPTRHVRALLRRVLNLTYAMKEIEVAWRRVGKGQTVVISEGGVSFTSPSDLPDLEAAIELVDARRMAARSLIGAPRGTAGNVGAMPDDPVESLVCVFESLDHHPAIPVDVVPEVLKDWDPWFVSRLNLDKIAPPGVRRTVESQARHVTLKALLAACVAAVWSDERGSFIDGWWRRYGIVTVPVASVGQYIQEYASQHAVSQQVAELVENHYEEYVRLSTFRAGQDYVISVGQLTSEFAHSVDRPFDGPDANQWARDFEKNVQIQIDKSPWRPSGALRDLIGRKVTREDGSQITDIDAVAIAPRALILIDAKSHPSTIGTRGGYFKETRDRRQLLERESAKWQARIDEIRIDPQRLKVVDLPDGIAIVGIVVVPEVPFLHLGPATAEITHGLRSVTAVPELLQALTTASANIPSC